MARGKLLTDADRTAMRAAIAAGEQPAEIARRMGRSRQTVKNFASANGLKFDEAKKPKRGRKPKPKPEPPPAPKRGEPEHEPQPPSSPAESQRLLALMAVDPRLSAADRIRAHAVLLDSTRRDGGEDPGEAARRIAAAMAQVRADALAAST